MPNVFLAVYSDDQAGLFNFHFIRIILWPRILLETASCVLENSVMFRKAYSINMTYGKLADYFSIRYKPMVVVVDDSFIQLYSCFLGDKIRSPFHSLMPENESLPMFSQISQVIKS